MKKLLILLVTVSLLSCKKEKTCYECKFGIVNNVQRPDEVICDRDPRGEIFKDADGNNINSFCKEIE